MASEKNVVCESGLSAFNPRYEKVNTLNCYYTNFKTKNYLLYIYRSEVVLQQLV
jgi:hypothetical protein